MHAGMFNDCKVYFANKGCTVHCMMHHQYMLINHLYRDDFLSAFIALRIIIHCNSDWCINACVINTFVP